MTGGITDSVGNRRGLAVASAAATALAGMSVLVMTATLAPLSGDPSSSASNALFVVGMVVLAATGALVVNVRGSQIAGWLMVTAALANVLARLCLGLAVLALAQGSTSAATWLGWLTNWVWLPGQVLAILLILRFPDGSLPGRRWRIVEWAVLGWGLAAMTVTALLPGALGADQLTPLTNPIGVTALHGVLDAALPVIFLVQPVLLAAAVAALVQRWGHSSASRQRQLRMVMLALLFLAVASPLALLSGHGVLAEGLSWLVLPAAIAYAVARHDLWDLDLRRRFDRLRTVREEERARLQRDLHDSLGPLLGSITMRVEAARNLVESAAPAEEVDLVLASIGEQAETAVVEVRRFIDELGPSALADTDLATALAALVGGYEASGVRFTLESARSPELPPETEAVLFRVAAEAVRNVVRHARAASCTLGLRRVGQWVELEVSDDGIGLQGRPAGVGRRSMAERVNAVGGSLSLGQTSEGGTRVVARVPGGAPWPSGS